MKTTLTPLSDLNTTRRDDPALRITATEMIDRLNDFIYDFAHELVERRNAGKSMFAHDRAANDLVCALAQFLTQTALDPAAVVRASQLTDLHAGDTFGTSRIDVNTIAVIDEGEE